jgi:geranylgeranyl pyrophosphate synthase
MLIKDYMEQCRTSVNKALNEKLPYMTKLEKAMSYAVLNGGKRLRSIFAYSVGELFNADKKAMKAKCRYELKQTHYSCTGRY